MKRRALQSLKPVPAGLVNYSADSGCVICRSLHSRAGMIPRLLITDILV